MRKKFLLAFSLFLFLFLIAACTTDDETPSDDNGQGDIVEEDNGDTVEDDEGTDDDSSDDPADDDSEQDEPDQDEPDQDEPVEEELLNIPETAIDADDFEVLVAALVEADLVSALEADGPFTVFAPNDAAFTALLDTLDATQEDLLARDDLADILLYHVVEGAFSAEDVIALASDGPATVETLGGGELTITVDDGSVFVDGIEVVLPDVEASNGVIHVLEGVLLPETEE